MLNTSYQVEDITPTKRGTGQEKKAKEESPRSHTKNGKTIPEGVTTKKKVKWSETTKKEINKLSKKQTTNIKPYSLDDFLMSLQAAYIFLKGWYCRYQMSRQEPVELRHSTILV